MTWQAKYWTAAEQKRLAQLWAEGKTLGAIARELGKSRNAVAGKAHRLKLDKRPSPIKRSASVVVNPKKPCKFPLWNHKEKATQEYCDKPAQEGSSYCPEHHSLCWQKPPTPPSRKSTQINPLAELARKAERQIGRMF